MIRLSLFYTVCSSYICNLYILFKYIQCSISRSFQKQTPTEYYFATQSWLIRWTTDNETYSKTFYQPSDTIKSISNIYLENPVMQKYIQIAFESRGIVAKEENIPLCEWCKTRKANDVDHIDWRWGKHNTSNRLENPENLIFVCRYCHQNKWWREWKLRAKEIVKWKIVCNKD